MEQTKLEENIKNYTNKYAELETAKLELQEQREQITKQLIQVEQTMIFLQGSITALQQLKHETDVYTKEEE